MKLKDHKNNDISLIDLNYGSSSKERAHTDLSNHNDGNPATSGYEWDILTSEFLFGLADRLADILGLDTDNALSDYDTKSRYDVRIAIRPWNLDTNQQSSSCNVHPLFLRPRSVHDRPNTDYSELGYKVGVSSDLGGLPNIHHKLGLKLFVEVEPRSPDGASCRAEKLFAYPGRFRVSSRIRPILADAGLAGGSGPGGDSSSLLNPSTISLSSTSNSETPTTTPPPSEFCTGNDCVFSFIRDVWDDDELDFRGLFLCRVKQMDTTTSPHTVTNTRSWTLCGDDADIGYGVKTRLSGDTSKDKELKVELVEPLPTPPANSKYVVEVRFVDDYGNYHPDNSNDNIQLVITAPCDGSCNSCQICDDYTNTCVAKTTCSDTDGYVDYNINNRACGTAKQICGRTCYRVCGGGDICFNNTCISRKDRTDRCEQIRNGDNCKTCSFRSGMGVNPRNKSCGELGFNRGGPCGATLAPTGCGWSCYVGGSLLCDDDDDDDDGGGCSPACDTCQECVNGTCQTQDVNCSTHPTHTKSSSSACTSAGKNFVSTPVCGELCYKCTTTSTPPPTPDCTSNLDCTGECNKCVGGSCDGGTPCVANSSWCYECSSTCGISTFKCKDSTPVCSSGTCVCTSNSHCPGSCNKCVNGSCNNETCGGDTPVCGQGVMSSYPHTTSQNCNNNPNTVSGVTCYSGNDYTCTVNDDTCTTCPNGRCGTAQGCASGSTCNGSGTCVVDPTDPCDECNSCQKCSGNRCVAKCSGLTPVCSSGTCVCNSTSCPSGKVCKSGSCVDDVDCTSNSDCTGECNICKSDGTCSGGTTCSADTNNCETCSGQGTCGTPVPACSDPTPVCNGSGTCVCNSTSCPSGKVCKSGSCVDDVDCTSNSDCTGECNICKSDGTCSGGTTCSADTNNCETCSGQGTCGTPVPACSDPTPVCNGSGTCVCNSTSCPSGQTCSNGSCVDDDPCDGCNSCQKCSGNRCVAKCSGSTPVCSSGTCECNSTSCPGTCNKCVGGSCNGGQTCASKITDSNCQTCSGVSTCGDPKAIVVDPACPASHPHSLQQSCNSSSSITVTGQCNSSRTCWNGGPYTCTRNSSTCTTCPNGRCGTAQGCEDGSTCNGSGTCVPDNPCDDVDCSDDPTKPICIEGICVCTSTSCGAGYRCENNECTECTQTCSDCSDSDPCKSCDTCTGVCSEGDPNPASCTNCPSATHNCALSTTQCGMECNPKPAQSCWIPETEKYNPDPYCYWGSNPGSECDNSTRGTANQCRNAIEECSDSACELP